MNCPACASSDTRVVDSRPSPDGTRRRRECEGCGHRFTTYELTAPKQRRQPDKVAA